MQNIRFYGWALILFFGIGACQPDSLEPETTRERTFVRFLHTYSPTPKVDIRMTDSTQSQILVDGLSFGEGWPVSGYASLIINAGDTAGKATPETVFKVLTHVDKDSLMPDRRSNLVKDLKQTRFLVDSFGKPILAETIDSDQEAPAGEANIKLVNLSYLLPSASVVSRNDSVRLEQVAFLGASEQKSTEAGTYTFYLINDFSGGVLDSIPNLSLRSRRNYRFFIAHSNGVPGLGWELLD